MRYPLNKTTQLLCLTLILTCANALQAQQRNRVSYLDQPPYNLNYDNRSTVVGSMYASGQDTVAWKWAWSSQRMRGMTYAQFRTLTYANVCILEATWFGEDPVNMARYQLNAYNMAYLPGGKYTLRTNTMCPRGGLIGLNAFGNYDQPDPNYRNYATTELMMDDANWIDVGSPERHLVDSPNAHLAGTNDQSYSEGFELRNVRLTGPYIFNDSRVRVGAFLRRLGSHSRVDNIHVDGFYDGVVFNGGVTPTIGVICPFDNERCGVGMIGSALATVNIELIEGDRNGEAFGMHAGYGSPAGGNSRLGMIKVEDGGAGTGPSISPNQVWRGSLCAYLEGQYTVTIGNAACSYSYITIDAPFVVNPAIPEFGQQGSLLNVLGGNGFGYTNLCHDLLHKTYLTHEGRFMSYSFRAWGDGKFHSDRLPEFIQVKSTPCDKALGFFVGTDGSISHTTCTPVRNNDPSAPPTGTWTCPPTWSICTNGTQTRACTCTGTGCPSPATRTESQTCTPPPPTCQWIPGTTTCTTCTNNSQTCTTPSVGSVTGCTPTDAKPAPVVTTTTCGTPPPTGSDIPPSSVLIVVNGDDPTSASIASAYMAAWGIPVANLRTLNLGNLDYCSTTALTTERAKLNATNAHQYIALCFGKPSRVGGAGPNTTCQSITSALTFGNRSVSALTPNPVLNYAGVTPWTDKQTRPSFQVLATAHIKRTAHGSRPTGTLYAIAAKDQNPPLRGNARAAQFAAVDSRTGFEYIDLRSVGGEIGYGINPYQTPQTWAFEKYEQLYAQYNAGSYPASDPRKTKFTKKPLAAAFLAMFKWDKLEEMTLNSGFYCDVVTSFAGYLPDGAGQTPISYPLGLGAGMATGLVSEPGSARTSEFVDVTKFLPLWQDQRKANVIAVWGSVGTIDRLLVAGDGLCAPYK